MKVGIVGSGFQICHLVIIVHGKKKLVLGVSSVCLSFFSPVVV